MNKNNLSKGEILVFFMFLVALLIVIPGSKALYGNQLSNESKQSKQLIGEAEQCFEIMKNRDVPLSRANESLTEAKKLYENKVEREQKGLKTDYSLVNKYANETCNVKDMALAAQDQLRVFLETYNETKKQTNLSGLQDELNEVKNSYNEERFGETPELIDNAYKEMSEIEAQQTTLNLFYESTRDTIENFFEENWEMISIIVGALIIAWIVFRRTLKEIRIRLKLKKLGNKKESLNSLIQKLQRNYFKTGKISEREFRTKMENYKKMIRDIERQVPSLKEEIHKIKRKKGKKS